MNEAANQGILSIGAYAAETRLSTRYDDVGRTMTLAARHSLTLHDASYLE
jgi:hypothetical protein